jgi:cobalt-zinc-cadmium resistance protein CzcA
MFRPMALTVMFALFTSLLLALVFLPAASVFVFRRGAAESAFAARFTAALERRYRPLLERMVAWPRLALATAVALVVGAGLLVPRLGTEFLPELDEGSILIETFRDPSVSLSRSIAMQDAMERVVRQTPEVLTVVSRVGRPDIGSDPTGIDKADVFVMLRPKRDWRPGLTKADLEAELEHRLAAQVPGLAFGFTQPVAMRLNELVSGVRADLAVKVFGDSLELSRAVAERIAATVARVPGAAQVTVEQTAGQGYLNVRFDRAALARFGIPIAEAQEALETAVAGKPVSQLVEGNWSVDVTVQYPPSLRGSPEGIGAITLPSPTGARISLRDVARIRVETGPVQVSREATARVVTVQANVEGRDLGGFAADVEAALAREVQLPPGTYLRLGGQFENQQRAMARLRLVLPLALLFIAALLYASLNSVGLAGLVLVNLPVASVGGVVALWARGLHLGVSAAIGFIALFGVAVLNGLVLLSTIQELRREGRSAHDAAVDGAAERLRPVLMTAMAASLGFLPVALSTGTGAEVQRPLATVVIGGLVTSTLLTLFVLPSLYVWASTQRDRR